MSLLDTASLLITPNGYKADKLYSIIPDTGSGDMTVTRATSATRVNASGLIESVGSNVPRLDYSNGSCPSVLVEPQRTNILPYSEDFSNAIWLKDANGLGSLPIVTSNYATSPSGNNTADRIQFSNAGGSGSDSNYSLVAQYPLAIASTGTATFYLKSNTSSNQNVLVYWGAGQGQVFVVTPQWQRFILSNLSISALTNIAIGTRGGSGNFYNGGDEIIDILVWGAQLEAGSYATSYIKTTSASVTRNADVISKTGISSLIGQTEGTLFVDFYHDGTLNYNLSSISNGLYDDAVFFEMYLGSIYGVIYDSGLQQFIFDAGSLSVGRHKLAIGYKTNDTVFYIDGVLRTTDTNVTIPTTARVDIGFIGGASINKTQTNLTAIWKTRLTNTQLAQLTTI